MNRRKFLRGSATVGAVVAVKPTIKAEDTADLITRIEPTDTPLSTMHKWVTDDLTPVSFFTVISAPLRSRGI